MEATATAIGTATDPWRGVWGQPEAVATLQAAAADPGSMTHACS